MAKTQNTLAFNICASEFFSSLYYLSLTFTFTTSLNVEFFHSTKTFLSGFWLLFCQATMEVIRRVMCVCTFLCRELCRRKYMLTRHDIRFGQWSHNWWASAHFFACHSWIFDSSSQMKMPEVQQINIQSTFEECDAIFIAIGCCCSFLSLTLPVQLYCIETFYCKIYTKIQQAEIFFLCP